MERRSAWPILCCLLAGLFLAAGCGPNVPADSQTADAQWTPIVDAPLYAENEGPLVLVDARHGNFHTLDGRFAPFGELISADGFRVQALDEHFSAEALESADVLVIANAIRDGADAEWIAPTPPAFETDEVESVVEWVRGGGSLLLIADHMPFPGAAADLASAFGFTFYDGFAQPAMGEGGTLVFTRADGSLHEHPITRGGKPGTAVRAVMSFTGQAFAAPVGASTLMEMPDDWAVYLTKVAWEFPEDTEFVSTDGLLQGAAMQVGRGRIAVFGEAAMFTAQTSVRDGEVRAMGMNHPEAPDNAQFVQNVIRWLVGAI